ncbi:MAG TPA: ribose-5-phosphate isomerase RpiA [Bryobacteraceae bacterium]|nr:ribose-5-phosphate isomerase RpiA [Bryobacteraceae bacterium]
MSGAPATDAFKTAAAEAAVQLVDDGMIVGLGSGSTATFAVNALGRRVREGLRITGIPTSEATAQLARQVGIPVSSLACHDHVDMTIDGADEVEADTLNLIKGHGGALLREKIVASASKKLVIVVDESKIVSRLGSHFAVPLEVVPFGWQATAKALRRLGASPALRTLPGADPFITDGGHYILDCNFGPISDPALLEEQLSMTIGVVEDGLFLGMTWRVFVGGEAGVRTMTPAALRGS